MKAGHYIMVLGALTLLAGGGRSQAAPVVLSEAGQARCGLLIDPAASESTRHAAAELATFLQQITGGNFTVSESTALPPGPAVLVGPGSALTQAAPDLALDTLKPDGIIIETRGNKLLLVGDEPRGTLYAVYTFLKDVAGCRWWSSQASTIPSLPDLTVPEQKVRYVPPLEYREPFWFDAFQGDFAVRNYYNGTRAELSPRQGGKITYGNMFVHTFDYLVPPETYFPLHPEWFSERNGQRMGGQGVRSQLCLTNPELKKFVLQQVLEWIPRHPEAHIISISQNDWDNHCLCAECMKIEEAEGSPMGPLLIFVNEIAAEVAKQYPHIAVDTLAYQYTRKPPKTLRPLPNVIIRLCSIECDFSTPLTSEVNKQFADDIIGWSKICNRLYVWDYVTNFSHYVQPHPNLRVLAPNVRFFVDHGVKGLFEQGNYQSHGGEFAELKAWVLAQLLWNPQLDGEQLVTEFVNGYYGPAAPMISEYINLLHDEVAAKPTYLSCFTQVTAPFINMDMLSQADKIFDQAETAVQGQPEYLQRVQVARLPLRYVWLVRYYEWQIEARRRKIPWPGPEDIFASAQTFMDVARTYNMTMISEGSKLERFGQRTIDLGRIISPPPPGCENLDEDQWIDLQDSTFTIGREGIWAEMVSDPSASDKVAVRMPGDHYEWAIQKPLAGHLPANDVKYTVYVAIRAEKIGDTGLGFSAGIYDRENKKSLGQIYVQAADIEDDQYHVYELGTAELHDKAYLWAAPPRNIENVKAIWVDRFWLVRQ
jgi:hypothetical protein